MYSAKFNKKEHNSSSIATTIFTVGNLSYLGYIILNFSSFSKIEVKAHIGIYFLVTAFTALIFALKKLTTKEYIPLNFTPQQIEYGKQIVPISDITSLDLFPHHTLESDKKYPNKPPYSQISEVKIYTKEKEFIIDYSIYQSQEEILQIFDQINRYTKDSMLKLDFKGIPKKNYLKNIFQYDKLNIEFFQSSIFSRFNVILTLIISSLIFLPIIKIVYGNPNNLNQSLSIFFYIGINVSVIFYALFYSPKFGVDKEYMYVIPRLPFQQKVTLPLKNISHISMANVSKKYGIHIYTDDFECHTFWCSEVSYENIQNLYKRIQELKIDQKTILQ